MRTGARNHFEGKVVSAENGAVGAIVKLKTDGPVMVTTFITKEAIEDLELKKGDVATAIVNPPR